MKEPLCHERLETLGLPSGKHASKDTNQSHGGHIGHGAVDGRFFPHDGKAESGLEEEVGEEGEDLGQAVDARLGFGSKSDFARLPQLLIGRSGGDDPASGGDALNPVVRFRVGFGRGIAVDEGRGGEAELGWSAL